MTGKISIVVSISSSDYEIIKVLQEHCFMVADIKTVVGRNLLLEIEAFSNLGSEDID